MLSFKLNYLFFLWAFLYASCVSSQSCGEPSIKPSIARELRIINGDRAVPNSWPWLVSLRYGTIFKNGTISKNTHYCGGSLIDSTTVITAGHCVDSLNASSIFVAIGTNSLNEKLVKDVNAFNVKEFRKHANYDLLTNDIAIIKLNSTVKFSTKVQPICLPFSNNVSVIFNQTVIVAGW